MRKVLILTNLPQRDQLVDEILANKLRAKGCDVRVTPFLPFNRQHVLFWKPDMVVIPEIRCEYTVEFSRVCMSWGIRVVVKRTEGGSNLAAFECMEQSERETVYGAWPYDCDLEVVWGEEMRQIVIDHGHMNKNKVIAVGAIPFDPYFDGLSIEKPAGRKNICIAPGWGHADRNPEYNVPEAPPGSPIHADAFNRHRQGRNAWLEMLKKLAVDLPQWDFFLRLKTGEWPIEYQQVLGKKCNIIMPCAAKVALANTDLLIHAGSTLAIEAHLMDMPALSFHGLVNQVPGYNYPHVSPDFTDADELIRAVKKIELGRSNANLDSIKELESLYGKTDGHALDRMADAMLKMDIFPTCIPEGWPPPSKEYTFEGLYKQVQPWVCEICGQVTHAPPEKDMIKCLHCGISLARRYHPDKVSLPGWQAHQRPNDIKITPKQ